MMLYRKVTTGTIGGGGGGSGQSWVDKIRPSTLLVFKFSCLKFIIGSSFIVLILLLRNVSTLSIKFTPRKLVNNCSFGSLNVIFRCFCITKANGNTVDLLLRYKTYNFGQHYHFEETIQRQGELFTLSSSNNNANYHETILGIGKLLKNTRLTRMIFIGEGKIPYHGNILIFIPSSLIVEYKIYWNDLETWRAVIRYAIENHMERMESLDWLRQWLLRTDSGEHKWIFSLLAKGEMIPDMLKLFLQFGADEKVLESNISSGLYPFPTLLIKGYYLNHKENLSNEEKILRILCVSLAVAGLGLDQGPFSWLSPLRLSSSMELLNALIGRTADYSVIIKVLSDMASRRTDRTFWSIYASAICLAYSDEMTDKVRIELTNTFISKFDPKLLSPYVTKTFLQVVTERYPRNLSFYSKIPTSHFPLRLIPLRERLEMWLRQGPIIASLKGKSLASQKDCMNVWKRMYKMKVLPIQMWYYDYFTGRVYSFLNAITDSSERTFGSGRIVYDKADVRLITSSWAYIMAKGKRLDFAKLFYGCPTHNDWDEFVKCISFSPAISSVMIRKLGEFSISYLFTPIELRQLVDSSLL